MVNFIPGEPHQDGMRTLIPDTQRILIPPHHVRDETGVHVVHPANTMVFGAIVLDNDEQRPVLRIDHAAGPTSLGIVLSADELRMFAEDMLRMAAGIEGGAADMLANALKKRPGA